MSETDTASNRRDFLKLAGASAPAAVLAATTGRAEAEEAPQGAGLRKTDHVRKYLETARF